MSYDIIDVLARFFYYIVYIILEFRMVAERVHQRQAGPHCKVQQQTERERLPCYNQVYSALLVKPTLLDPTRMNTTTWPTSTKRSSDINMLAVPKQPSHRRELHSLFEGNKPDQQHGPMTTFKNWAAE
eukprot:365384-Amphidinium_carterae.1